MPPTQVKKEVGNPISGPNGVGAQPYFSTFFLFYFYFIFIFSPSIGFLLFLFFLGGGVKTFRWRVMQLFIAYVLNDLPKQYNQNDYIPYNYMTCCDLMITLVINYHFGVYVGDDNARSMNSLEKYICLESNCLKHI
jgi:hypothetical protein